MYLRGVVFTSGVLRLTLDILRILSLSFFYNSILYINKILLFYELAESIHSIYREK